MMKIHKKSVGSVLLPLILFLGMGLVACEGSDPGITVLPYDDGTVQITDGSEFDPSITGETTPCTTDSDGHCVDSADNTDSINLPTQIDFGVSETGAQSCNTLSIPGGFSYTAEIMAVGDATEFTFRESDGTETQDAISGNGALTICYLRTAVGTHTGQIGLALNLDSTSGSAYGNVIVLSGETTPPFFTITSPIPNQIIDAREGHHEGTNDDEGDYTLTASGSINMDLVGILQDGIATPILITSSGVLYSATLDDSGHFTTTVGIRQTPGIYTVSFSAATNNGTDLTKELSVFVATTPDLEIEVRDETGALITADTPADTQNLIVGFKIKNLSYTGFNTTDMPPIRLHDIAWNHGTPVAEQQLWYGSDLSWCSTDEVLPTNLDNDYLGFASTTTYCVPLSDLSSTASGVNTISATATNDLGDSSDSFTLILDYNKPLINITTPQENQLYPIGTTEITITGTVENYAPPTSVDSSVMLWVNQNTEKQPIFVYPELPTEYQGLDTLALNQKILDETPERCRDYDIVTADDGNVTHTALATTSCNLPKSSFSITLDSQDPELDFAINLYSNIIEMRATALAGGGSHRSQAIRLFATGVTSSDQRIATTGSPNTNNLSIMTRDIKASLGHVDADNGLVNQAPFLFNLSQGVLQDPNTKRVIEKLLNDHVPFADIANGWSAWPRDDNDNIDLEADFHRQYRDATGEDYDELNFENDLSVEWQEKFIQQALHSSNMAEKLWALARYQKMDSSHDLFERTGNPEDEYNVALDRCEQPITTAFVPLGDLRHIAAKMKSTDDVNAIPYSIPEWPDIAGDDIAFNDFVSGRWIIQSIAFDNTTGETGTIHVDACLVPQNADVDNCNDDIPYKNDLLPAFWGHVVAYNLIDGGATGEDQDPTLPLIWSVGKLRIKLTDVLNIKKVPDGRGGFTNKITIDRDGLTPADIANGESKIVIATSPEGDETLHDNDVMAENSIQIYPYSRCADYYQELLNNGTYNNSGLHELPFGCHQNNDQQNFPFLLEKNSTKGMDLFKSDSSFQDGNSTYLLSLSWQLAMETFGKVIRCADEETLNPLINSKIYPYPTWTPESAKLNTSIAIDQKNGKLSTSSETGNNTIAIMSTNLADIDLSINHSDDASSEDALTLRLPFSMTVNDVLNTNLFATAITERLRSDRTTEIAHSTGHLVRTLDRDETSSQYPLSAENAPESPFASVSVNVEDLINTFSYLIFKKGPFGFLDTRTHDLPLEYINAHTARANKVTLSWVNICTGLSDNLLSTDLPPGLLFSSVSNEFDYPATSWDIEVDPNSPITLAMEDIPGLEGSKNATDIKLAINNLQIGVRELQNSSTQPNGYRVGDEDVVRLRLDGILSLKAIYHPETFELAIFIEPYTEQNIHLSVVPGHSGSSYDDVSVIYNLQTEIIPQLITQIAKTFSIDDLNATPSLSIQFATGSDAESPINLTSFLNAKMTVNMEESSNGTCDGITKPYYVNRFGTQPLQITPADIRDDDSDSATSARFPGLNSTRMTPTLEICTESINVSSDPFRAALCDLGIQNVAITPTLQFDNDHGYIHLSSDLAISIYDWLQEGNE